jgi:hypothetical protein
MLGKLKRFIKRMVYAVVPPPYVPASYAQAGEDVILRFLFADMNIHRISYLDLGTNRPDYFNNTYLFYLSGSRGVCVEADKTLIANIRSVRPEDKCLNVGVAVSNQSEADFHIFEIRGLNTFDRAEAEARAAQGERIIETIKVPLIDINTLIKDNFVRFPDLISIDIEVLRSLDFNRYPVPVICAETCVFSQNHIRPKNKAIHEFMMNAGYEMYADTYINTIFVNRSWFYQTR